MNTRTKLIRREVLAAVLLLFAPVLRAGEEENLIGVLNSDAAPNAKGQACARLKVIGTPASVPSLAALLADEVASHAARNALESMPGPEASAALREALGRTSGLVRVGVIDSLGRRRDTEAVAPIVVLLRDADAATASAAAAALGRIGGRDAVVALMAARETVPEAVRADVLEALLLCGEQCLAGGDTAGAAAIGRGLLDAPGSPYLRAAAWQLVIASDAAARVTMLPGALTGEDRALRAAATGWLRESADLSLVRTVLAQWDALPAEAQLAAMDAQLRLGGDAPATVHRAAASPHAMVKRAAWAAMAGLGDPAAVPILAGAAAAGDATDRAAAREALVRIGGPGIREAMLVRIDAAEPPEKAELIAALGVRADRASAKVLLCHAEAEDESVRAAALKSLRAIASLETLPPLLDLATRAPADRRSAILQALQAVAQAAPDRVAATSTVLEALGRLDPGVRATMLSLLPGLGSAAALDAAKAAAMSDHAALAAEGVRTLARWPAAAAAPALMERARDAVDPSVRVLAVRGILDHAGREADAAKRLDLLRQALQLAARPDEKMQALGLVGVIHTPTALDVALAALDDASIAEAAGVAAIGIAEKIAAAHAQAAAAAAVRLIERCKTPEIVRRAQALATP